QLIMDSLRYWVQEMHVDGFRFDLASALARELYEVDQLGAFFDIIHQDPVLSQVKLIAEPWDLGQGGYQVGNFPILWTEWNGKYRDCVRRFWRGDGGMVSEMATRLAGSSDLYARTGRRPYASINFVTAHDGFTLRDLVSYNGKHNEANGEDGRDGADDNESWNCGAEGETDDQAIIELRERQKRNFLATLFCSQGVPMITSGDEIGRTQGGNNNGYCQDNEITWLDWNLDERRQKLFESACRLAHLRKEHPNFKRRSFSEHDPKVASQSENVRWIRVDGQTMSDEDWNDGGWKRTLGMLLFGDAPEIRNADGTTVQDDDFLLLLNSHHEPVGVQLPPDCPDGWYVAYDTARPELPETPLEASNVTLEGRSMVVLGRHRA
ncbi:MAG: glycogen debranching enzyme GlgX, partial [Proteobacteria bacterium]